MRLDKIHLERERLRLSIIAKTTKSSLELFWRLFPYFTLLKRDASGELFKDFGESLALDFLRSLSSDTFNQLTPQYLEQLEEVISLWTLEIPGYSELPQIRFEILLEKARRLIWVGENREALELLQRTLSKNYSDPEILHQNRSSSRILAYDRSFQPEKWMRAELLHLERFKVKAYRNYLAIMLVNSPALEELAHGEIVDLKLTSAFSEIPAPKLVFQLGKEEDESQYGILKTALEAGLKLSGYSWRKRAFMFRIGINRFSKDLTGTSYTAAAAALVANDVFYRRDRIYYHFRAGFALTGDVDAAGNILPVNSDSLAVKLERVFWSPMETVGIPAEQEAEAREIVQNLHSQHPQRNLDIVPLQHIRQLFQDHRISQRNWSTPLTWAYRRANKKHLTVSGIFLMLAINVLLFFTMLFPQYQPWTDREIHYFKMDEEKDIYAFNQDSLFLWKSNPVMRKVSSFVSVNSIKKRKLYDLQYEMGDVNADGKKEVVFPGGHIWNKNQENMIKCLNHQGKLLWEAPFSHLKSIFPEVPDTVWHRTQTYALIDWNHTGKANLVINQVPAPGYRGCRLVEIEGATGRELSSGVWKRDWWLALKTVECNGKSTLWAGSRDPEWGFPILAIFSDSIPDMVWPPKDTSKVKVFRFPLPYEYKAMCTPGQVQDIHFTEKNTVLVGVVPDYTKYRDIEEINIAYHFSYDGEFVYLEYSDGRWARCRDRKKRGLVPPNMTRLEYVDYLNHYEIWDGKQWVAAEPERALPDTAYHLDKRTEWWPVEMEKNR